MIILEAPAKINLALDILYKRSDGYHEIDSVMQTIRLADQLTFECSSQFELTCSDSRLPTDQRNLAWRAAELLQQVTGVSQGVKIHILKNIPIAAGLAGGSADAAAVLTGLNQLWGLNLSTEELMNLGVRLGADVPFCIHKGAARAGGIGEKLTVIRSQLHADLLLVTPNVGVSTALAYNRFQAAQILQRPQVSRVVKALESGDMEQLTQAWGNVFEELVTVDFPVISRLKNIFCQFGLKANLMSGSGPSVFTLNPPAALIEPLCKALPPQWFHCLTSF
jgi:4-diphosphocytidyl-2-C-methyl-D-erythritol kinase